MHITTIINLYVFIMFKNACAPSTSSTLVWQEINVKTKAHRQLSQIYNLDKLIQGTKNKRVDKGKSATWKFTFTPGKEEVRLRLHCIIFSSGCSVCVRLTDPMLVVGLIGQSCQILSKYMLSASFKNAIID